MGSLIDTEFVGAFGADNPLQLGVLVRVGDVDSPGFRATLAASEAEFSDIGDDHVNHTPII